MATATINYDDGWIRFWPDGRLDDEEYAAVTKAGIYWKRAEQCFASPWAPSKEDFLKKHYGVELEEDETDLMKLAEQRADYYQGWSDNAAKRSQAARKAVNAIADHIPFGQPILVGHHSERRARRDADRIHNGMMKSIEEGERSGYWAGRAQAAVDRIARRYKRFPLLNRIKELEAEQRRFLRDLETEGLNEGTIIFCQRWLDYCTKRLAVARTLLEALPKPVAPDEVFTFERGGGVQVKRTVWCVGPTLHPGQWYLIHAVNKNTLTINDADGVPGSGKLAKLDKTAVGEVLSAAEWEASQPPRPTYEQKGEVITAAEWKKTHNDYKGIDGNGQRRVMRGGMGSVNVIVK